jgi:hypothetical protein
LATFSLEPWPHEFTNINYYTLQPGSPGVELDWRTWLVGLEHSQGTPYLFFDPFSGSPDSQSQKGVGIIIQPNGGILSLPFFSINQLSTRTC